MSSHTLPSCDAAPTGTQAATLRQQFIDLSADYFVLRGAFEEKDEIKKFAPQQVSWTDFEQRCANLRSKIQVLGQNPPTASLPQISTDYNSLVADFEAILGQLVRSRITLEGSKGHKYAFPDVKFLLIGNRKRLPASPPPVRKPKTGARRQRTTVSKPAAKMEKKTSLPSATSSQERNQSVMKDGTSSKSGLTPAVQPLNTPLPTTAVHHPDVSSLESRVHHLESANASMKTSLRNLNNIICGLRKEVLDKNMENGRNEVENLKVRGIIRDYRDFVDELAPALDRLDPSFFQSIGELKGNKVIIKLRNGTKLWVDRSNRSFQLRDAELEHDDKELLERMKRLPVMGGKKRKRDLDVETETDGADDDGDFEP